MKEKSSGREAKKGAQTKYANCRQSRLQIILSGRARARLSYTPSELLGPIKKELNSAPYRPRGRGRAATEISERRDAAERKEPSLFRKWPICGVLLSDQSRARALVLRIGRSCSGRRRTRTRAGQTFPAAGTTRRLLRLGEDPWSRNLTPVRQEPSSFPEEAKQAGGGLGVPA